MIDLKGTKGPLLFDTGVALRAFGERPADPRSPLCRELFEEAKRLNVRVLVSALSVAEILRGRPDGSREPSPVPRTKDVIVVPFGDLEAQVLGKHLPFHDLKIISNESGLTTSFLRFDSLIVATAMRYKVEYVVTLDGGMSRRYPELIQCVAPSHFLSNAPPLLVPKVPPPKSARTR